MKRYYSPSTRGFYIDSIHNNIPSDKVEISKDKHISLIDGQNIGNELGFNNSTNEVFLIPKNFTLSKWNEVKSIREDKITSDLEYEGGIFQMDHTSLDNLKDQLAENEIVQWRLLDNTVIDLEPADIEMILRKYRERKKMLYIKSWEVEYIINNSEDAKNLDVAQLYEDAING